MHYYYYYYYGHYYYYYHNYYYYITLKPWTIARSAAAWPSIAHIHLLHDAQTPSA